MRIWLLPIVTAVLGLTLLMSCGKRPDPDPVEPQYCKGAGCLSMTVGIEAQCVTVEDPKAQGIFAQANGSKTEDGSITTIYQIEVRSVANEVLYVTSQKALLQEPHNKQLITCNTGRETVAGVKQKVFRYFAPICSTSRSFPLPHDCASRPPEEQWPAGFRYPRAPSLFADEDKSASAQCLAYCQAAGHPLCKHFQLPETFSSTANSEMRKALSIFHQEVSDGRKFPITADRMKQVFEIDPREYGRGADIYLNGENMGQLGEAVPLPFIATIGAGSVRADIMVPTLVEGRRSVDGEVITWTPMTAEDMPRLRFPNNADLDSAFGGKISQIVMTDDMFMVGTSLRCAALDYGE
nr:hypothetical protein [uncultured Dongia sp.]